MDDLFETFGINTVPADFVVVVDTSGSMSDSGDRPYPKVLKAYDALVDAIPEGDNLSVISFYGSPELAWQGKVTDGSRGSAKDALPKVASGENTDIGAALDQTIRRLERADSSQVQTVIVLTDGQHNPGSGSKYPTESGPGWDALRGRADQVATNHDLIVQGIGLGEQGAGGIALLRNVFGNPEINNLPAEQLPDYFREAVRRSQLARLKHAVNEELDHRVTVAGKGTTKLEKPLELQVPVRSEFETLSASVDVESVTVVDADGKPVRAKVLGGQPFELEPGETHDVTIRLQPTIDDERFTVPAVDEEAEYDVQVLGGYQVQPKDTLARVTDKSSSGDIGGTYGVTADRTYGWTVQKLVSTALLALVVALILWWLYRRFLQLPKLVGVFVVENAVADDKRVIEFKGKRQRVTGKDVPGAGAAKIELFTRRGKPKRLYARVEHPPFFESDDRRDKVVTDETEIRLARYRLGGGKIRYKAKAPTRD